MAYICNYVQRGESIDYKNTGAETIPNGAVVALGKIGCVAVGDIEPQAVGVLAVDGVFDMPSGATAFAAGAEVDWDATASAVVVAAGGVKLGWVIAPTTGNGRALVKLSQ